MYSINVFLTFSITLFGLTRHWFEQRRMVPRWKRPFLLSVLFRSLLLCSLGIMVDRYFYVFPQRPADSAQGRLSAWPLAGDESAPPACNTLAAT